MASAAGCRPTRGPPSLAHLRGPVVDDAELHAVALRQRDPGLAACSDDEDVLQARREGVAGGVPPDNPWRIPVEITGRSNLGRISVDNRSNLGRIRSKPPA